MFRQVNGKVRVRAPGVAFHCPAAEFTAIEPDYTSLPKGIIERRYDPNAPNGKPVHVLITVDHRQTGGPVPWPEGDAILARAASYPGKHAAAFPPQEPESMPVPREKPAAPREPKGTTIAALRGEVAAMRRALIDAGVWRV